MRLRHSLWLIIVLLALPRLATARDVVICQPWRYQPIEVTDDGRIAAMTPDKGWVFVRPHGVDGPRPDAACSTERLRSMIVKGAMMMLLSQARQVAFCGPRMTADGNVEATVLIDGADVERVLASRQLTQPLDGSPRIDWCAR